MVQISNPKPDVTALLSLASQIQSHLFWQKQYNHRVNERPGAAYAHPECQDNAFGPLQILAFQLYTEIGMGLENRYSIKLSKSICKVTGDSVPRLSVSSKRHLSAIKRQM
jgi:hypothetical protein